MFLTLICFTNTRLVSLNKRFPDDKFQHSEHCQTRHECSKLDMFQHSKWKILLQNHRLEGLRLVLCCYRYSCHLLLFTCAKYHSCSRSKNNKFRSASLRQIRWSVRCNFIAWINSQGYFIVPSKIVFIAFVEKLFIKKRVVSKLIGSYYISSTFRRDKY